MTKKEYLETVVFATILILGLPATIVIGLLISG